MKKLNLTIEFDPNKKTRAPFKDVLESLVRQFKIDLLKIDEKASIELIIYLENQFGKLAITADLTTRNK